MKSNFIALFPSDAYLEDVLLFGSHINQQIVYYPFQTDVHIPTELGRCSVFLNLDLGFDTIMPGLTSSSKCIKLASNF